MGIRIQLAAVALMLAAATCANAGILSAHLTANPATINEGNSSTLTLDLQYQPPPYGQTYSYYNGYSYYQNYYYNGTGQIDNFSSTIYSGDGQSTGVGASVYGTHYSTSRTFSYDSPGTYTASVAGTANVHDNWQGTYGYLYQGSYWNGWGYSYYSYWNYYQNSGSVYSTLGINASTQIHVNNLDPSITGIQWDAVAFVGDTVNFAVDGSDPAGIGTSELMTFAYDLNNDGNYDDYAQSGGLSSSGSTTFAAIGVHTVGVRLTDGQGGVTYGTFDVNVVDAPPAPSAVPEPATLTMWGLGALGCAVATYRRRKHTV